MNFLMKCFRKIIMIEEYSKQNKVHFVYLKSKMQNQKNPNHFNHQFIRKPRRKQSPKPKNQNLYNFKCNHKQKMSQKLKEEYQINENGLAKNDSDIVLDLKNQLSFLKQEMAKIVHTKIQAAQNENNTNKLKMLDYYFPSNGSNNLNEADSRVKTLQSIKSQEDEKSISKEVKKIKSKQRLKFSKIKKQDKFSPISQTKKSIQSETQTKDTPNEQPQAKKQQSNQQKQVRKQDNGKNEPQTRKRSKKSMQNDLKLDEQVKKISQKHKLQLTIKLNSLIQQQQNRDMNVSIIPEQDMESKVSPRTASTKQQQKSSVGSNKLSNINTYQLKMTKFKKQLKQYQSEVQSLKKVIKEKNNTISKLQIDIQKKRAQLQRKKEQIVGVKQQNQRKDAQIVVLHNKLSELDDKFLETSRKLLDANAKLSDNLFIKNQIQSSYLKAQKQLKTQKQLNAKMSQELKSLKQLNTKLSQQLKSHKDISNRLKQNFQITEHKLKNREMEVVKLEKHIKNTQNEINEVRVQKNSIIEALRKQINSISISHQEQLQRLKGQIKRIEQQIKKRQLVNFRQLNSTIQNSNNVQTINIPKSPRQQASLSMYSSNTKGTSFNSNKQKQLLNVIKMHQKSIQNYQKDLSFLQSECKNLHFFKQLSKKQQIIIKQTNQLLISQQLQALNAKYQRKALTFSSSKEFLKKGIKHNVQT